MRALTLQVSELKAAIYGKNSDFQKDVVDVAELLREIELVKDAKVSLQGQVRTQRLAAQAFEDRVKRRDASIEVLESKLKEAESLSSRQLGIIKAKNTNIAGLTRLLTADGDDKTEFMEDGKRGFSEKTSGRSRDKSRDRSSRKCSRDNDRSRSPDTGRGGKKHHTSGQVTRYGRHNGFSNINSRDHDSHRQRGYSRQDRFRNSDKPRFTSGLMAGNPHTRNSSDFARKFRERIQKGGPVPPWLKCHDDLKRKAEVNGKHENCFTGRYI